MTTTPQQQANPFTHSRHPLAFAIALCGALVPFTQAQAQARAGAEVEQVLVVGKDLAQRSKAKGQRLCLVDAEANATPVMF